METHRRLPVVKHVKIGQALHSKFTLLSLPILRIRVTSPQGQLHFSSQKASRPQKTAWATQKKTWFFAQVTHTYKIKFTSKLAWFHDKNLNLSDTWFLHSMKLISCLRQGLAPGNLQPGAKPGPGCRTGPGFFPVRAKYPGPARNFFPLF